MEKQIDEDRYIKKTKNEIVYIIQKLDVLRRKEITKLRKELIKIKEPIKDENDDNKKLEIKKSKK